MKILKRRKKTKSFHIVSNKHADLTIGGICGIGGKKYGAGAPGGGLSSDAIGIPGTIGCGIIIGI